jgi:hypothetical protein
MAGEGPVKCERALKSKEALPETKTLACKGRHARRTGHTDMGQATRTGSLGVCSASSSASGSGPTVARMIDKLDPAASRHRLACRNPRTLGTSCGCGAQHSKRGHTVRGAGCGAADRGLTGVGARHRWTPSHAARRGGGWATSGPQSCPPPTPPPPPPSIPGEHADTTSHGGKHPAR